MRSFELFEKTSDALAPLKTRVIASVKATSDSDLLNKIYSSLNSTNITGRISRALDRDEDVKQYLNDIVDLIVSIPAEYEEKIKFSDGLINGYVDVKKMLSGKRVHFEDLLITNAEGPSISFIKQVFKKLKDVGDKRGKGPGEFSLAVLSPKLTIFGSGDIKIGNKTIEVKASAGKTMSSGGGRIGTTGFLQHQRNAEIIKQYIPALDTSKDLNLSNFSKISKNLDPKSKKSLATELFTYIFEAQPFVNLKPLITAYMNDQDLSSAYLRASYQAYQGDADNKKFDGIMLMNFSLEELRYYEDPDEMFKEIYSVNPLIISANKQYAGRSILPTVTLRGEEIPKVDLPRKGAPLTPDIKKLLTQYADMMLKSVRIRDPQLQSQVTAYITNLWKTGVHAPTTFNKKLLTQFPQLRRRK
jgi:hypothetical protein